MMLPPQTRDLALRLLAYENAAGKTSEPTEFAAFGVCERLRQPLITLAGVAGFRSLLSRALTLARAEAPSLNAVQVAADGSLQGLDGASAASRRGPSSGGRNNSHYPVTRAACPSCWRSYDVAAGDI